MILIGTAGWSIPRAAAAEFPGIGSHLQRYSRTLRVAEINSSFHRPHARSVYERWALATPAGFRFSVKLPRSITHDGKLRRARAPLTAFLAEVSGLGTKLGPLLVQLPPSLEFNGRVASSFFSALRDLHHGAIVCEPRHASWFGDAATALLVRHRVARVATDPPRIAEALRPGAWMGDDGGGFAYYRLHGAPRMYWSKYPREQLAGWAEQLRVYGEKGDAWCIFDNTASGAAAENAVEMAELTAT